jgi:hypothetical protein
MTHNELCNIETTATRAIQAMKTFGSSQDKRQLDAALVILAKVRHAGMFLCDINTSPELRVEVIETLVSFIQNT